MAKNKQLRNLEKKYEKSMAKAERIQSKLVKERDKQTASANGRISNTASPR